MIARVKGGPRDGGAFEFDEGFNCVGFWPTGGNVHRYVLCTEPDGSVVWIWAGYLAKYPNQTLRGVMGASHDGFFVTA